MKDTLAATLDSSATWLNNCVSYYSPRAGAEMAKARAAHERGERGEVSVGNILWVALGIVFAGTIGLILLNKLRDKANNTNLDQGPLNGVPQ